MNKPNAKNVDDVVEISCDQGLTKFEADPSYFL